ncbi:hypothetical protein JXM83_04550 [Candidatus Woesearchaeota archaeon]|nr:hypothetical protein [Candidatus Woesearchaeota archaeon]
MQTTIQLRKEVKDKLRSFGTKDDTYEDIILRLYNIAVKEQFREFITSSKDCISIDEARKRHSKLWSE